MTSQNSDSTDKTNPHNCGTCNRESCSWYSQRDQLSRINSLVNREYVDHFSMRLATEMIGCDRWRNHAAHTAEKEDCGGCYGCPRDTHRDSNPCPVEMGEMKECDQFKCPVCCAHCGDGEDIDGEVDY